MTPDKDMCPQRHCYRQFADVANLSIKRIFTFVFAKDISLGMTVTDKSFIFVLYLKELITLNTQNAK